MPELPEVETIIRDLRPKLVGRVITGLILREKALAHLLRTNSERFYQGIMNQMVTSIVRKGKYIIIPLANGNVLVFHLGMTGKLLVYDSPEVSFDELLTDDDYVDRHTHMLMEFTSMDDKELDIDLHFNDVRLFGNMWLLENVKNIEDLDIPGLKSLGPDALGISLQEFEDIMGRKRSIKAILLDQSKIAGVGNIYADEACFIANVHPAMAGSSLTEEQLTRFWLSVKYVLKQGIKYRGSSISDYLTADGSEGSFQNHHQVYGKTGEKCVECDNIIEKMKIVGRATHFCPYCQRRK